MNQGLGSRADDTGRAAPRAIPGAEEAEPPNLGCLQRLAKASDPRPQLISTTTSHHAPIGPTTPPPGNVQAYFLKTPGPIPHFLSRGRKTLRKSNHGVLLGLRGPTDPWGSCEIKLFAGPGISWP